MAEQRDNRDAMRRLAASYAEELNNQLGTLSYFTSHTGEVGRAHEYFLRSALRRFLPPTYTVGTGFVALPNWTSTQLDILISSPEWPVLFQTDELAVVDGMAAVGAVEVKSELDKRGLCAALNACKHLKAAWNAYAGARLPGRQFFFGIYAADGISLDTLVGHFQAWALESLSGLRPSVRHLIPDVIYVRKKYACFHDPGMSPAYAAADLEANGNDDGVALLAFAVGVFNAYMLGRAPWWAEGRTAWDIYQAVEEMAAGRMIHWPKWAQKPEA